MTTFRPDADDAAVLGCMLIGLLTVLPALVGLGLALLHLYGAALRPVGQWLLRLAGLG